MKYNDFSTSQTIDGVLLLPCPFCGRTEEEFHRYSRKLCMDLVECIRCFCGAEINDYTTEGASKLWNSRATTTPTDQRLQPSQRRAPIDYTLPTHPDDDEFVSVKKSVLRNAHDIAVHCYMTREHDALWNRSYDLDLELRKILNNPDPSEFLRHQAAANAPEGATHFYVSYRKVIGKDHFWYNPTFAEWDSFPLDAVNTAIELGDKLVALKPAGGGGDEG